MISMKTDLVFLHAPSVYDFRKKSIMFGPMSDLVPSTPIFEMYPIGFLTMANYLERRGIKVRIANIAYRMLEDKNFDAEKFIKKLRTCAFGIDFHWMPHCQGSVEIARIVKKYHPETPVIFGGFSSSYFYEELIKFPQVDFIVRGDSAEEPLYQLIKAIKENNKNNENILKEIPNLVWKRNDNPLNDNTLNDIKTVNDINPVKDNNTLNDNDTVNYDINDIKVRSTGNNLDINKINAGSGGIDSGKNENINGNINVNKLSNISEDLEEIDFDYRLMFKQAIRYCDFKSIIPFTGWFNYPITTIPVVRGCNNNCSGCGGSKYAFEKFSCRKMPAFRNPEKLVDEISIIQEYINAPVFILGDLNNNGEQYVKDFFRFAVKKLDRNLQIFFEFFEPPGKWVFDIAAETFKNVCYEISPDSHDEKIREIMGKSFSNRQLTESIEYALKKGALRFDLYFMTGLPYQTKESIMGTVDFCREIFEKFGWDKRFMPFISPMAPFMDPGSRAFENPEKFGYKLIIKTLAEHIEAITMPSWKYILNYKSNAIDTDDLVEATYDSALGLNRLKGKSGGISKDTMQQNEERIKTAKKIMAEIDGIMEIKDPELRERKLSDLKNETDRYSMSTVCEKRELEFPFTNKSFRWFKILKTSLSGIRQEDIR